MEQAPQSVDLESRSGTVEDAARRGPRWFLATSLYSMAIVAATWPYVLGARTGLPSLGDPLQHLWLLRWYRTALAQGISPLRCMDLQYPFGTPLASYSPLHLQSVLFIVASLFIKNDILIFNIIWFIGLLTAGLGTYTFARWVLGSERPALLAGLLAMLSGPVLMASHCFLELIFVGTFPLFLMAWIKFLDKPGAARLVWAVVAFVLVTMSAAYYLVLSTVAAGIYLVYAVFEARREGSGRWLQQRLPWIAVFAGACLPALALLFASQIIGIATGQHLTRSRAEFDSFGMPFWTYLVPTPRNRLFLSLGFNPYEAGKVQGEPYAYLGVVTLVLMGVALRGKTGMRRPGLWWLLVGTLVLLSLGSYLYVAGARVELPASWLWKYYPPFRLIRVPARFKYFVAVIAALIAGGGLASIEKRLASRRARWAVFMTLAIVAVADLSHTPYTSISPPPMPSGYTWLLGQDPSAAWVDVPQISTSGSRDNFYYMYWQSIHGGRTTGGSAGHSQLPLDDLLSWNSPFLRERLADPGYLSHAEGASVDIVTGADLQGYIWTYLTVHDLPYVVVNRWADAPEPYTGYELSRFVGTPWYGTTTASAGGQYHGFDALRSLLAPALIYEDNQQSIYSRDRLPRPTRPVVLSTTGWLTRNTSPRDGYFRPVSTRSEVAVYNPDASRPLVLTLRTRGLGADRQVKLLHEGRELFAFIALQNDAQTVVTPPLSLPAGLQRLELQAEGSVASGRGGHHLDQVREPVSLLVSDLSLATSVLRNSV